MNLLILLVTIPLLWQCSYSQQAKKFFRKDYTYLENTRSFYKIHTLHKTWMEAKKRCALEGASLFYPEHQAEADTVIEFWNKTQPFYWLYIGVSSLLAKGVFETIDGTPIEDVYHNWSPGEPNNADGVEDCVIIRRDGTLNDDRCYRKYPFTCKKSIDSLQWNTDCNSPNIDYKYNPDIGRCYKFHLRPQNWTDAHSICNAEQSYLAVIDNQKEADYLVKLTAEAPKDKVKGDFLAGAVHLGFHNRQGEGWTTIKGQTLLEDSGYNKWSGSQPDGGDNEQCGSMFYNGDLNDVNCSTRCFFICEHDVDILGLIFDDRTGGL